MFKNELVKKSLCMLLTVAIFLPGCGGSVANPVDRYMPGDEKRSCAALFSEMTLIDNEIQAKQQKIKDRDFWNFIEFVGGCVIIVPFFFMDCKGSYEVEIDALKARQKMLKSYFAENSCSVSDLSKTTDK